MLGGVSSQRDVKVTDAMVAAQHMSLEDSVCLVVDTTGVCKSAWEERAGPGCSQTYLLQLWTRQKVGPSLSGRPGREQG